MQSFYKRHPVWSIILLFLIAGFVWLIATPWSPGLEQVLGRKRIFLNAVLSGITLGALAARCATSASLLVSTTSVTA
jgi:branched-chain amino acid transport system permease protein